MSEPDWLLWTREMQAIAQTGLEFTRNPYDQERYQALRALAARAMAVHGGGDPARIEALFAGEQGYATPKVDVRGAAFRDGRILLSYGKRFPEGWSQAGPNDDFERFEKEYPGEGLLKLAISEDGSGSTWQEVTIGRRMDTCYSCIFEVEPNVIFCQVDNWCLRVHLRPKRK